VSTVELMRTRRPESPMSDTEEPYCSLHELLSRAPTRRCGAKPVRRALERLAIVTCMNARIFRHVRSVRPPARDAHIIRNAVVL